MADETTDFLMGGGVISAAFPTIGTVVSGTICEEPTIRQQVDFETREPKFWPNGDPMRQLVVVVQTDERDEDKPDDDGRRAFYIKYHLRDAVRAAVQKAGAKGLAVGGKLAVKFSGQDKPRKRGMQGAKLYKASYTPPSVSEDFLADEKPGKAEAVDEPKVEPEVDEAF